MTYLIRPDDTSEVDFTRFYNEIHLCISSDSHTWVLVVPNGIILRYIAETFIIITWTLMQNH